MLKMLTFLLTTLFPTLYKHTSLSLSLCVSIYQSSSSSSLQKMTSLYNQVPSVSAVFSLYTNFSAIMMLFRTVINEIVPIGNPRLHHCEICRFLLVLLSVSVELYVCDRAKVGVCGQPDLSCRPSLLTNMSRRTLLRKTRRGLQSEESIRSAQTRSPSRHNDHWWIWRHSSWVDSTLLKWRVIPTRNGTLYTITYVITYFI